MQYDGGITHRELRWDCEVHLGRLELPDAVDCKGGLVGDDSSVLGPQRPPGEVVVNIWYPLHQAEDPPVDAVLVACAHVVRLGLVGVPDPLGLGRCEVAALLGGEREEALSQISTVNRQGLILYRSLSFGGLPWRKTSSDLFRRIEQFTEPLYRFLQVFGGAKLFGDVDG